MSFDPTAITNDQMRADVLRILEQVLTAEAWNDPRVQSGGVTSSGKPESRAPGRQQCKALYKEMRSELHEFADKRQRAQEKAAVYESVHEAPEAIGGVETQLPEQIAATLGPITPRQHPKRGAYTGPLEEKAARIVNEGRAAAETN